MCSKMLSDLLPESILLQISATLQKINPYGKCAFSRSFSSEITPVGIVLYCSPFFVSENPCGIY